MLLDFFLKRQQDSSAFATYNFATVLHQLEVDYYMIGKMKRAYIKILGDAEQLNGLSKETITGLRAISRDLTIEFKAAFNRAKNDADNLLQRDVINPKQFAKIMTDTADKLGD